MSVLDTCIRSFLDSLLFERGLSRETAAAYGYDLEAFSRFLTPAEQQNPGAVPRRKLTDFLVTGRKEGLKPTTLARRLVAIKMFYRFMAEEGMVDEDIAAVLDSPTLWRQLPGILSPQQVDALLRSPDQKTVKGRRDGAMLDLMYACGLRVSELCTLRTDQLHFKEGYIRVRGKGRKERLVPVAKATAKRVMDYLDHDRPVLAQDPDQAGSILFLSVRSRPLTRQRIWQVIRELGTSVQLPEDLLHPHSLRHSFASHLLSSGAPLRTIQEMLGHADIGTTQIYTHVDQNRLNQVHKNFHPRA